MTTLQTIAEKVSNELMLLIDNNNDNGFADVVNKYEASIIKVNATNSETSIETSEILFNDGSVILITINMATKVVETRTGYWEKVKAIFH